ERLEHTVSTKRKVLTLALRWAATHSYLLQEEPIALSFLEKTLIRQFSNGEERLQKKQPIRNQDDILLKVYCSDHTYTTIRVAVAATGREVIRAVGDKLGSNEELLLKQILKPNDVSVFSAVGINGRLFSCPREQLNALMTLYDWELFSCVHEHELLYHTFGRTTFRRTTANLDLFLRRFNQVQLWVVTEVCLCSQLSKRVQLLKKFIKIAAHCREFRNLNSFFAIIMGMSNPAVSRLSQTWEKLPSKFKKFYAEFESMMDPSRNHRAYRLTVTKLEPPIIPFMPLLLK
ncbi:hypothetical protein CRUP_030116, partial [Coryphaenoides rupestris]